MFAVRAYHWSYEGEDRTAMTRSARETSEQRLAVRYEALLRVVKAIGAHRDATELFRALANELRAVVSFDYFAIFLYDEVSNRIEMPVLEVVSGHGFALPPDFRAEDTITWWVYRHQQPVVVSCAVTETRFPRMMEVFKSYGVQSACVLPLTTVRRRLGGLSFGSAQPKAYSDDETRILSIVADQVALAVDNALRDREQRRSHTILTEGQQLSQTGSWSWNPSTGAIRWSAEHSRIFAVSPDVTPTLELFWRRVYPEDRSLVEELVERAVRDKSDFKQEYRLLAPDGSVKYVLGLGRPVVDETGNLIEFIGTTMDISERKRIEEELRKQKAHFEELFELAPEAVVVRDIENRVLRANKEFTKLFGYSLEEALGKNISSLIVPDELWDESEELRKALKRGERVDAELIRRRKDGTRLNISFVAAPVSFGGKEPEIYGIYRDITERKKAEEQLRRSEAYLAEGQRLSHTGSWARNVETGEVFLSRESLRIFGFDPTNGKITLEKILQRIHGDDRASVSEAIQKAIRDKSDFETDYRIVLDDGAVRDIHVLGHPVLDAVGKLVEFVGTHMDVTEQHDSRVALEKAFEEIKALKDQLYQENVVLREEIDQNSMFEDIVGKSAPLRRLISQVETVAATDSTVLIHGETGTGKELIARAIHNLGDRASRPFVKLNCAAIPTGLLESELFGHEKGAFTGATSQRVGRFELANHGTVFLDEIGDISPELQPKLLRVLQEREFERLGSTRTLKTDARLIAATNRDLSAMVEEQKFRADLYYRLNVFPIAVPTLRERKEDIDLLVRHFVEQFTRRQHKHIDTIPTATMNALREYHWPGNIRELQNVIERAVIVSTGTVLQVPTTDLKPRPATNTDLVSLSAPESLEAKRARLAIDEAERRRLLDALEETEWTVGGLDGAAARLGLKRSTLQYKMRKLGIPGKRDRV